MLQDTLRREKERRPLRRNKLKLSQLLRLHLLRLLVLLDISKLQEVSELSQLSGLKTFQKELLEDSIKTSITQRKKLSPNIQRDIQLIQNLRTTLIEIFKELRNIAQLLEFWLLLKLKN
jgi:hypothetical protein